MNAAEFRSFSELQFQSETPYFGSTQKNRFILVLVRAKLRQGLGVVLRRYRQYYRERGDRTVKILDISIKNLSFIKMHLKFVNAHLEVFAYRNSETRILLFQEHSGSLVFLILKLFVYSGKLISVIFFIAVK